MKTIAGKSEVEEDLKSLPWSELQAKLGSSPDGLSLAEAQQRLAQYGYNEIAEKKINPFLKFLTYFWGPIPWMIEAAVNLDPRWSGTGRIFSSSWFYSLANAVVGFWEEYQAGNAIAALKAKLAVRSRVPTRWKVDQRWRRVNWCPGDVIRVRLGDIVPADACLLEGIRWKWTSPR